jgi:hypothetical protein
MRREITCRPASAEGGSVRPHVEEEIAEFLTLEAGDVNCLHAVILAQMRHSPDCARDEV